MLFQEVSIQIKNYVHYYNHQRVKKNSMQ
ncbi:MAG: IS3 family transposase [Bacteroidales bacterium]